MWKNSVKTYCRVYWPDSMEHAGSEFALRRRKTSLDCCLYSVKAFSVYTGNQHGLAILDGILFHHPH
jgi:hypothetical protein